MPKISDSDSLREYEKLLQVDDLLEFDLTTPIDAQLELFDVESEFFAPKFINFNESVESIPKTDLIQELSSFTISHSEKSIRP